MPGLLGFRLIPVPKGRSRTERFSLSAFFVSAKPGKSDSDPAKASDHYVMNQKKVFVFTVMGIGSLLLFSTWETLRGIYLQKIAFWEEETYIGRPLQELENMLRDRGETLSPLFHHPDNREYRSNEDGFRFTKGEEYRWFIVGSALNEGFVIVEKCPDGPIVKQIIRGRSMNSL